MTNRDLSLRLATAEDIGVVAHVVNTVSEGVVEALLGGLLPGKAAEDVLALVFGRRLATYVPENVMLAEVGGRVAGLCFAYDAREQPVPPQMTGFLGEKRVAAVQPLLTATYPNALWVNTLWTDESVRGRGLGRLLLRAAAVTANDAGLTALALNCWAENIKALAFYAQAGFTEKGVITVAGSLSERHPAGGRLLVKPLGGDV